MLRPKLEQKNYGLQINELYFIDALKEKYDYSKDDIENPNNLQVAVVIARSA